MRPIASALACATLAAVLIAGCTAVPRERAADEIGATIATRGAPAPGWPRDGEGGDAEDARVAWLLQEPLHVERAVQLAFLRNARIRELYAALGLAQADVLDAVRLSNPTLGYIDLNPRAASAGQDHQITRSVSLNVADLLLLPARSRLARGEFERVRHSVAAALIELSVEVETAWYAYTSARQVAAMRSAVARAAASSAEFARRSFDAGNLAPRDLALELAAATEARVAAANASAQALRARAILARHLGISTREQWETPDRLPAPPPEDVAPEAFIEQALTARLDVVALRRKVSLLDDALGVARRWRFLGVLDVGYERESETDGARVHGPALALQLPLFNQGQGSVLRARSELEAARARLTALELNVRNEVAVGLDELATARSVTDTYRTALVPQREEVVRRELERYNFMLGGVFQLLQAKRQEYDAYQAYLESVRDYWLACTELRRAVGGQPVCNAAHAGPTIGVDEVLTPRGSGQAETP